MEYTHCIQRFFGLDIEWIFVFLQVGFDIDYSSTFKYCFFLYLRKHFSLYFCGWNTSTYTEGGGKEEWRERKEGRERERKRGREREKERGEFMFYTFKPTLTSGEYGEYTCWSFFFHSSHMPGCITCTYLVKDFVSTTGQGNSIPPNLWLTVQDHIYFFIRTPVFLVAMTEKAF